MTRAQPGEVIQVDPEKSRWGPIVCVVDTLHEWGVVAYWLSHNQGPGGPVTLKETGAAYIRVPHDSYVVIGKAEWVFQLKSASQSS